jgi:hypothetical protein
VARAVRAALDALAEMADGPLAARFTAPLVTAIVADADEGPWLVPALSELSTALAGVGVPRGRQFVLLGHDSAPRGNEARARATLLRRELALAAVAHTPAAAAFTAGQAADGTPIELDDELREAEAVICIGHGSAAAGRVHGGPYLLLPGVASERTRRAFAAARARGGERAGLALALAAEAAVPVDLALCWDDRGRIVAARGREHFAALARTAGLA